MNHSIESDPIAEVGIDREAAAHCLTLLSSFEGAADTVMVNKRDNIDIDTGFCDDLRYLAAKSINTVNHG